MTGTEQDKISCLGYLKYAVIDDCLVWLNCVW